MVRLGPSCRALWAFGARVFVAVLGQTVGTLGIGVSVSCSGRRVSGPARACLRESRRTVSKALEGSWRVGLGLGAGWDGNGLGVESRPPLACCPKWNSGVRLVVGAQFGAILAGSIRVGSMRDSALYSGGCSWAPRISVSGSSRAV
jgi:hypothetical protein